MICTNEGGDIFESGADAIVNTINCVGNMGGGLAKAFRERYPVMNEAYQMACALPESDYHKVKVGKMWNWWDSSESRWLINFPTKDDWRDPSEMRYVWDGLEDLAKVIKDLKLASIAIPALGCGLGGLDWVVVEPLIVGALGDLCDLELYPPH